MTGWDAGDLPLYQETLFRFFHGKRLFFTGGTGFFGQWLVRTLLEMIRCFGLRLAMGGYDPYSASKGCAELVTRSFTNSFFPAAAYGKTHHVAVASGRAGNAIGGGDFGLARLIPDCIRAFVAGNPVVMAPGWPGAASG